MPCAANLSMFGVWCDVPPYDDRHSIPKSSARTMTILGFPPDFVAEGDAAALAARLTIPAAARSPLSFIYAPPPANPGPPRRGGPRFLGAMFAANHDQDHHGGQHVE